MDSDQNSQNEENEYYRYSEDDLKTKNTFKFYFR